MGRRWLWASLVWQLWRQVAAGGWGLHTCTLDRHSCCCRCRTPPCCSAGGGGGGAAHQRAQGLARGGQSGDGGDGRHHAAGAPVGHGPLEHGQHRGRLLRCGHSVHSRRVCLGTGQELHQLDGLLSGMTCASALSRRLLSPSPPALCCAICWLRASLSPAMPMPADALPAHPAPTAPNSCNPAQASAPGCCR